MKLDERNYLHALSFIDQIGFQKISLLYDRYNSYENIWKSDVSEWNIFSAKQINEIIEKKKNVNILKEEDKLQSLNIKYLTILDPEYPELLKQISSPPLILYYKGDIRLLHSRSLGIVGTRMPSGYGFEAIKKIVPDLVTSGFIITSGFQRGIDTAAHRSCIDSGGKTIAVLGTGIDIDYPTQNTKLHKELVDNGHLIITEYPLGMPAHNFNFPRRNRIISGLSLGVWVVEAEVKSGSLITAQFAVEQNREVFALPGSIFDRTSTGPHYLIQQGAKLITCAADILQEFNFETNPNSPNQSVDNLSNFQLKILALLDHSHKSLDELIEILDTDVSQLSSDLTELQLSGHISQMDDGKYIKI
jgi:DNA processing protein